MAWKKFSHYQGMGRRVQATYKEFTYKPQPSLAQLKKIWEAFKFQFSCYYCGGKTALFFYHVEGRPNNAKISFLVHWDSLELLMDEIENCQTVCRACYLKHHLDQKTLPLPPIRAEDVRWQILLDALNKRDLYKQNYDLYGGKSK